MRSTPFFLRLNGQPVILLGEGEAAAAKRRLLERGGAVIVGEDNADARIAMVAMEGEEEAIAAVKRLKARGLLVNAVDRPALCDFTTPAIIDRGSVLVAMGTGGASAGLAKALRQRFEALLPSSLGDLANALFAARATIKAKWPDPDTRRRAIDAALQPGGALDPLVPHDAEAVARWLEDPDTSQQSGAFTIALRSNDPDDLTINETRLLGSADRVYHDVHVPKAVLNRIRADAVVFALPDMDDEQSPSGDEVIITLLSVDDAA
ncbi:bifunctional precorrin-2 dehydrogenase/sirohydrochlorin ferrochelatase [Sphingorhabdus sp. Alg239-R122]|uniref:precorrin-2 dehydrogenase/sirohydrochlorin ferrochelatase family protein n=1 Tax=Sphingorhabdus sp. Alg239-R122 TaxID=2305989 RepID=UPI0013D97B1C|nr:bifunctional precorrin-2 dehydrogenase/sirohydrochlorin ferrochelatase [Sphingorhabdus sp. Alg239-R122]